MQVAMKPISIVAALFAMTVGTAALAQDSQINIMWLGLIALVDVFAIAVWVGARRKHTISEDAKR
jgi:hypothetical protein